MHFRGSEKGSNVQVTSKQKLKNETGRRAHAHSLHDIQTWSREGVGGEDCISDTGDMEDDMTQ